MHDKYVRRRRVLLAALVATSLILLTAYFGEADDSPLHSIQQGIVEVFTPIQEGASKVLSPVRDLSNWVSSTLHAKTQNSELVRIVARQRTELGQDGAALERYDTLTRIDKLTNELNLSQDGPVYANVTTYNPSAWYENLNIDKGSGAGIAPGDPVLSAGGLVGDISSVGSNYAVVSELSNPKFQVFSEILDPSGKGGTGTLGPSVGNPTTLEINYLPADADIQAGDEVVTAAFTDRGNPGLSNPYPAGIPIGSVSNVNPNQLVIDGTVNVSPDVSLRALTQVEILTHVKQ